MKLPNKQKVIDWYIHRDIRLGRGLGWINKPKFIGSIIVYGMIVLMYFKIEASAITLTIIGIAMLIVFTLIGELDYRKGILLRQADIGAREYSPFNKNLMKTLQFHDGKLNFIITQNKNISKQLREHKIEV